MAPITISLDIGDINIGGDVTISVTVDGDNSNGVTVDIGQMLDQVADSVRSQLDEAVRGFDLESIFDDIRPSGEEILVAGTGALLNENLLKTFSNLANAVDALRDDITDLEEQVTDPDPSVDESDNAQSAGDILWDSIEFSRPSGGFEPASAVRDFDGDISVSDLVDQIEEDLPFDLDEDDDTEEVDPADEIILQLQADRDDDEDSYDSYSDSDSYDEDEDDECWLSRYDDFEDEDDDDDDDDLSPLSQLEEIQNGPRQPAPVSAPNSIPGALGALLGTKLYGN